MMPRLLRATCRASDAVFCLNSTEASYLAAEGWAAADRVNVLPNGVEAGGVHRAPPRAAVRELLFVGQWLPAKGIAYLVQAFTDLAAREDVRLTCVGTGALARRGGSPRSRSQRGPGSASCPRLSSRAGLRRPAAADLFVFPTLSEGSARRCSKQWPPACRS